jgi:hypothetical protein
MTSQEHADGECIALKEVFRKNSGGEISQVIRPDVSISALQSDLRSELAQILILAEPDESVGFDSWL